MYPKISSAALKEAMIAQGFESLNVLAKAAGVHRNTLYPLARGEASPFSDSYLAICFALKRNPVSLLEENINEDLDTINNILKSILDERAWVYSHYAFFLYGSRATGKARKFSDYDIGVTGGEHPVHWRDFLSIKDLVDTKCQDLPVKVSLLNFDQAPEVFLDDFDSRMDFLTGNKDNFSFFKGWLHGRAKNKKAA